MKRMNGSRTKMMKKFKTNHPQGTHGFNQKLVVFLSAATGKVIEDLIKVQKRLITYWYGVQEKAKQPLNLMSRTY